MKVVDFSFFVVVVFAFFEVKLGRRHIESCIGRVLIVKQNKKGLAGSKVDLVEVQTDKFNLPPLFRSPQTNNFRLML